MVLVSTWIDLVANSTPIVDFESRLNSFLVNLLKRLDFPTPLSPMRTTAGNKSAARPVWQREVQDKRRGHVHGRSANQIIGHRLWMEGKVRPTLEEKIIFVPGHAEMIVGRIESSEEDVDDQRIDRERC